MQCVLTTLGMLWDATRDDHSDTVYNQNESLYPRQMEPYPGIQGPNCAECPGTGFLKAKPHPGISLGNCMGASQKKAVAAKSG